jgi:membrane protein DedA with SNARE-associated domain
MKLSQKLFFYLSGLSGFTAYGAILGALLVCGLGLPIPEDVTLLSAGVLASVHNIRLPGAIVVGFFGVLAGDTFLFFMGRLFGPKVFLLPGFRTLFNSARIHSARERIQKDARMICFIGRFLPGLRAPIYLTAGMMHVKPSTFLIQDGLAASISVPLWVYIGYLFGSNIDGLFEQAKKLNIYIISMVGLIVLAYVAYKLARRALNLK